MLFVRRPLPIAAIVAGTVAALMIGTVLGQTPATSPSPGPSTPAPSAGSPSATPPSAPPPAASPQPSPSGVTEITRASDGQTVHVPQGGTVTVRMGTDLDWAVSFDPPGVLQPIPGVGTLQRGVQALLRAAQPGTTSLIAEGKPHCDPGQVCAQFIVSVIVTIVVDPGAGAGQQPAPAPGGGATPVSSTPAVPSAGLPMTGAGIEPAQTQTGALYAVAAALAGFGLLLAAAWRLRGHAGAI